MTIKIGPGESKDSPNAISSFDVQNTLYTSPNNSSALSHGLPFNTKSFHSESTTSATKKKTGLLSLPDDLIGELLVQCLNFELALTCKHIYSVLNQPGIRASFAVKVWTLNTRRNYRGKDQDVAFKRRMQRWVLGRDWFDSQICTAVTKRIQAIQAKSGNPKPKEVQATVHDFNLVIRRTETGYDEENIAFLRAIRDWQFYDVHSWHATGCREMLQLAIKEANLAALREVLTILKRQPIDNSLLNFAIQNGCDVGVIGLLTRFNIAFPENSSFLAHHSDIREWLRKHLPIGHDPSEISYDNPKTREAAKALFVLSMLWRHYAIQQRAWNPDIDINVLTFSLHGFMEDLCSAYNRREQPWNFDNSWVRPDSGRYPYWSIG